MFNFEKLKVWQLSRQFANDIYKISEKYPEKERFILIPHTCKSSISILSNLAEGASRQSPTESKRFVEIALGSLFETVAQLFVALDNKYIDQKDFDVIYNKSEEISRMLNGLSRSFKRKSLG